MIYQNRKEMGWWYVLISLPSCLDPENKSYMPIIGGTVSRKTRFRPTGVRTSVLIMSDIGPHDDNHSREGCWLLCDLMLLVTSYMYVITSLRYFCSLMCHLL